MPASANLILLPLDALGAGGKKYGTTPRETILLPALNASGSVYYHSNGAVVLPMVTVAVAMRTGGSFSLNQTLPQLQVVANFGANADIALPMLTFAGNMTLPGWWNGASALPMLTVSASGITGANANAALTLPQLVVSMTTGSKGAALLPQLTVTGSVSTAEKATLAATLPLPATTGTISVFSYPGGGAVVLPALVAGPYGSGRVSLPMLQVLGIQLVSTTDFEGWAVNTRNEGITRITNFPFTQFATVGNKTYAIGAGGLYLLGGDNDNGTPIVWQFETGLSDVGRPGIKHIPYLYLDGIIDGEIEIVLIDDRSREFAYHYNTKQRGAVHLKHRRKLGNGIRTTNMAFRIKSDTGAYIELDALEPEITVTQRSI